MLQLDVTPDDPRSFRSYSMNTRSTLIGTLMFLVVILVSWRGCLGQSKMDAFFDPDEVSTHRILVADALKQICPRGLLSFDTHGNATGCHYCPPQATEHDADDLSWDLKRTFAGHFTSPDEENIVLTGRGCESHSANFGGTFVFAVNGSVPQLLHYESALITERCHKFRVAKSMDMLVCVDDWGAQVTLWSYVYLVKFHQNGQSNVQHIFETVDKSRQACGIDFFDGRNTSVQKSGITALEFAEPRDKSLTTLAITATLGEKSPTDEERRACQQGKPVPLTLNTYRMTFLFDGNIFRPARESEKMLELFPKAESAEHSYSTEH